MTLAVAFNCVNGVVVAADSMLTSIMGSLPIAHHKGRKVNVLKEKQLFAFAGDLGLGDRFRFLAESLHKESMSLEHPIDYPLILSQSIINQFRATGLGESINLMTILAYTHNGVHVCCAFEGQLQPRLLDNDHFYCALGSGKMSADPFLRFLVDIFCPKELPTVREAVFLATWVTEHVILTNPGGVAGPIRVGVLEKHNDGSFDARELPDEEIQEHLQAIESVREHLRVWKENISTHDPTISSIPPWSNES